MRSVIHWPDFLKPDQAGILTNLSQPAKLLSMTPMEVLQNYKKITVVGLSPKPNRPSHQVSRYLMDHGYEITGVRPGISQLFGRPVYKSLAEVPEPLEIVNVFRNPRFIPEVAAESVRLGAKVLWLQEGIRHPEAEAMAQEAGLDVISDLCILKEHLKL